MKFHSLLKNNVFHLSLVVLLGLLVYSNTYRVPFQLDDVPNIYANPIIKDLSYFANPSTAQKFTGFAEYHALKSRYIGHLSFALNWYAGGPSVTGFHVVNTIIHILSALLVYALTLLSFQTPFLENSRLKHYAPYVAFLAAALFTAHPVQTQSVTYIVQRLASMAAMFYLLSLTSYAYSRLSSNRGLKVALYILALAAAVLGMKTKENVFTLPLAIAMYELFFFSGTIKQRLTLLTPFALTMLIIPLTIINIDTSIQALMGEIAGAIRVASIDTSRGDYFLTETRVLLTYLRLIFFPFRQNLFYDYPVYQSILNPNVFISILLHIWLISFGIYLFLKARTGEPALRLISLGIFWFYMTLSVESTLVPLFMIYEHRVYLPSSVLFMSVSVGAFLLFDSLESQKLRAALAVLMTVAVLILGGAASARNTVWQSERSLWEDNVRKAPGNVKARASLGDIYAVQGRYDDARAQYEAALSIDPEHVGAMVNLANIHLFQGRGALAAELYTNALEINPYQPETYNNLGFALMQTGQVQRAARYFQSAIDLDPRSAQAHLNLGKALLELDDRDGAIRHFRESLALVPSNPEAIGLLQKAQGK